MEGDGREPHPELCIQAKSDLETDFLGHSSPWIEESCTISWGGMRLHPGTGAEKWSRCLGCRSSPSGAGIPCSLDLEVAVGRTAGVSSQGAGYGRDLSKEQRSPTAKRLPSAGSMHWSLPSVTQPQALKMASAPFSPLIHTFSLLTVSPPASPVPNKSP